MNHNESRIFLNNPLNLAWFTFPYPFPQGLFGWKTNDRQKSKTQRFFHRLHRPIRFIKGREVGPPRNYTLQDLAYGKMLYGDGNDHFVETYDFSPFCRGTFKGNVLYIYIYLCVCVWYVAPSKTNMSHPKGPQKERILFQPSFFKDYVHFVGLYMTYITYMTNLMMGKGQLTFPT